MNYHHEKLPNKIIYDKKSFFFLQITYVRVLFFDFNQFEEKRNDARARKVYTINFDGCGANEREIVFTSDQHYFL